MRPTDEIDSMLTDHPYRQVHVLHKGSGQWYEMQDLHVKDILPQMITLTEAYIQVGLASATQECFFFGF